MNKFDNNLKKALTEYEKEIVESAENQMGNSNVLIIPKKWLKYAVVFAAIFVVLLPTIYIGKNINENKLEQNYSQNYLYDEEGRTESNEMTKSTDDFVDNINLSLETLDFNTTVKNTKKLIQKYKGTIENQDISNLKTSKIKRYAIYGFKIPDNDVDNFVEDLENLNINIINTNSYSYNVSEDIKNIEKNLDEVNKKIEKLEKLLANASTIGEITEIESKILESKSEKSNIEESLQYMNKEANFSTIYLEIQEVEKYSGTENINEGFMTRVKKAFSNSLIIFVKTIQNIVVGIITLIPFIVTIGVSIIIVIYIKKKK